MLNIFLFIHSHIATSIIIWYLIKSETENKLKSDIVQELVKKLCTYQIPPP